MDSIHADLVKNTKFLQLTLKGVSVALIILLRVFFI
jgi:hypothetical protein